MVWVNIQLGDEHEEASFDRYCFQPRRGWGNSCGGATEGTEGGQGVHPGLLCSPTASRADAGQVLCWGFDPSGRGREAGRGRMRS